MNIVLTWDLSIIIFFVTVIAYSFIIGRDPTLKNIIATYVAVLTADGVVNLANQYLAGDDPILVVLAGPNADEILIIAKILLFIATIVIIAVRGGFEVSIPSETTTPAKLLMTLLFGTLNAGLIVSTLLLYVSGLSLIGADQISASAPLESSSPLVQLMIENYNLWFSLPAIAFVVVSLVEGERIE